MVIYTYVVWLAALHAMGCGPDGNEMHQLLLGLAPAAVAFTFVLRVTREFPDIQRMLSWLGTPLVLLLPFCVRNVWHAVERANLRGVAICGGETPAFWEKIWAPVQFIALLVIAAQVVIAWRSSRRTIESAG